MSQAVFMSFLYPYVTQGTAEQLEDWRDGDAGEEGQGLLSVSVSRAARGSSGEMCGC